MQLPKSLTCPLPFYLGFKWKKKRRTKTRRKIFYWLFKKENFRKKNSKDFWNIQIFFEEIKFSGPEKKFFRQYQLLHFYFEKWQFDMLGMKKNNFRNFFSCFSAFFQFSGFLRGSPGFFALRVSPGSPPPPFHLGAVWHVKDFGNCTAP